MKDSLDEKIFASFSVTEGEPVPTGLRKKIMRRVFFAGYGKYLVVSSSILVFNLAALAVEVYRALTKASTTTTAPVVTMLAMVVTTSIAAYATYRFARAYKNPTAATRILG